MIEQRTDTLLDSAAPPQSTPTETTERKWLPATRVALYTMAIVLVLVGFAFVWTIRNVIFLIFLSILLATAIEPLVKRLRRGPFSKGQGILIVYSVIILMLAGLLFLTIPPLVDEATRIVSNFPQYITDARTWANTKLGEPLRGSVLSVLDTLSGKPATGEGTKLPANVPESALGIGLSVLEAVFSFVTVFVIAFYWLTERPTIKRSVIMVAPNKRRNMFREVWDAVEEKLGGWVRGQLLLMIFIGVADAIFYTIFGLHYALVLAVFAGLAEIIPIIGPYVGGVPAILVALTQGADTALIIAAYIVVVQLIEGNLLVPRIMERSVGVSPLTVIVGILIGSTLAGIAGALVAVPIAAAIQVTIVTINARNNAQDAQTPGSAAAPVVADSPQPTGFGRFGRRNTTVTNT